MDSFEGFFFIFYFILEFINNAVLLLGVRQSDSVMHIHISTPFQIPYPFRLSHNTGQSSLIQTAGRCWLSILNIVMHTCQSW